MALAQKDRDKRRHDKAARLQEEDLRLKVRPGTKQALAELMEWADIEEQGEALTLLIHNIQGRGMLGVRRLTFRALHKLIDPDFVEREDLRLKAMPGTIAALEALKQWLGAECYGSVISAILQAAYGAGPTESKPLLALPPRNPYVIPATFARRLENELKRKMLTAGHP